MSQVLQFYDSTESSDSSEEDSENRSNRKIQRLEYLNIKVFDSASAGFDYIKTQKLWRQRATGVSHNGKRIYYDCKYSRNSKLRTAS